MTPARALVAWLQIDPARAGRVGCETTPRISSIARPHIVPGDPPAAREQRHQSRLSFGLTIGSIASARSMKVMAVMTMSRPGDTTHHQ